MLEEGITEGDEHPTKWATLGVYPHDYDFGASWAFAPRLWQSHTEARSLGRPSAHGRARSPARRFRHHGGSTTAAQRKPRRSRLAGAAETGARPPGGAALATSAAGVEPRSRPRRSGERVSVGRRCSRRPPPHRAAEPPSRLCVAIACRRGGSSAFWTGRRRLDEGNGSVDEGR